MKTEAIKTESKVYICEFCGKKSIWAQDIENCEFKHKQEACPHIKKFYELQTDGEDGRKFFSCIYGVVLSCKECQKILKRFSVYDLDPKFFKDASFQMDLIELIQKYSKPSPTSTTPKEHE